MIYLVLDNLLSLLESISSTYCSNAYVHQWWVIFHWV